VKAGRLLPARDRRRALALVGSAAAWPWVGARAQAGLEAVIAGAKPSVVAVGIFKPTDNPRFGFRGSGFVVGSGNLVVTNAHVLPEVLPPGGTDGTLAIVVPAAADDARRLRPARLLGMDRAHDLALLAIDGPALPPLPLAPATPLREGRSIAIIGFPIGGALGFTPVTHRGIVASVTGIALPAPAAGNLNSQAVRQLRSGSFDIYQLDATAYPGNSGGPVLDAETGQVVAVINMVLVKGSKETAIQHPSGISYAVPVRFVHELLTGR
jgi:S1-C subfamily serine protease